MGLFGLVIVNVYNFGKIRSLVFIDSYVIVVEFSLRSRLTELAEEEGLLVV